MKLKSPMERYRDRQQSGETISPSLAIKAMCWQCKGGQGSAIEWDAEIRAEIRDCGYGPTSVVPCPLWEFRPYRSKR